MTRSADLFLKLEDIFNAGMFYEDGMETEKQQAGCPFSQVHQRPMEQERSRINGRDERFANNPYYSTGQWLLKRHTRVYLQLV
jgi:hypothetical protein